MHGKYPESRYEMRRADYNFMGVEKCGRCSAEVERWMTTNRKEITVDPAPDDYAAMPLHRCKPKAARVPGTGKLGLAEAERELSRLRERSGAEAAVLVFPDPRVRACAWRAGLEPEEARNGIISAANFVRAEIRKGEQ